MKKEESDGERSDQVGTRKTGIRTRDIPSPSQASPVGHIPILEYSLNERWLSCRLLDSISQLDSLVNKAPF